MEKYFSKAVKNQEYTEDVFEITSMAEEKESKGEKVIHMEIGRPDFDTPEIIKDSAIKSLKDGDVHYTEFNGLPELKSAIAGREMREKSLDYNSEDEILVTVGASEALYCIWTAFLDKEDEILVPTPYFSSYANQLTYVGTNFVEVPTLKNNKIKFDIKEFEKRLTDNTKMILINSPNNPTGYVLDENDLQDIADFAIKNDLLVVSDECYDTFVFNGRFESIASLPGMKDRTLVVNSSSKTFSMTGWRIGYVMGNKEFIREIGKIHSNMTVCATSFAQSGAITAYKNDMQEVKMMVDEFERRKNYVIERFSQFDKLEYIEPDGAFYLFFTVERLGMTGLEFCKLLLLERNILLAPGISYGSEWKHHIRLSYGCSMEEIKIAMDAIEEIIEEI